MLLRGLPYVDGLCVHPTEWQVLDPSRRPSKKHKPLTREETMVTVDAFHPDAVAKVMETRAVVGAAWNRMQDYW